MQAEQGLGGICDWCQARDPCVDCFRFVLLAQRIFSTAQAGLRIALAGKADLELLILRTPPPGAGVASA